MYESEKLDEAEYFLPQMAKCQSDPLSHKYNLSTFCPLPGQCYSLPTRRPLQSPEVRLGMTAK
jgi:hypothetical protein